VPNRLLLVDDEEKILVAMARFFGNEGYEVDCASDLDQALTLLAARHYELVLADLRLGGSYGAEGLEIATFVRERCVGTRTIILTGYGTKEIEAEAARIGVDGFLHKPQPLAEVARIVVGLLRSVA
jgi:DNA-binding response OmpR family regulator